MTCLCCKGDIKEIIRKKCGCWVWHFKDPPWETEVKTKITTDK